jgi:zinc transporter
MSDEDGLICAFILDGKGGGREVGWPEIRQWQPSDGPLWVHIDRKLAPAQQWLRAESGVGPLVARTMLEDEVRPRALPQDDALLVILRGVNLNPGQDPEDMIGIRVWIDGQRVITARHQRIMAVNDVREMIADGKGPKDTGDFLTTMTGRLIDRMGPVIDEIDDTVDRLEDELLTAQSGALRTQLGALRRQAISLRRHLTPQRDVLGRLFMETVSWLDPQQRAMLREVSDRTLRYLEDLEAARERAAVIQEELHNRLSDQMNRTMYLLTVVAAILLPPSLITGLFGINVGGMPGVDNAFGFAAVVVALVIVALIEIVVLRRLKWI